MNANRTYKDSVFTMLFNDSELLRELYYALGGVKLSPDVPIFINTLEYALVRDVCNDISFIAGSKLVVLIEHQSTINPNMALRFLMYISESYKRMIDVKKIYSSCKVSLPYPEFYVLYNGVDPYPDKEILKLSDLFENPNELGLPEKDKPLLELEVQVLNINQGRNNEIVNRSRKLTEYSLFIAKVREFKEKVDDLLKAIRDALKYCKEHDILREYLEKYEVEVMDMLFYEYDKELEKEVLIEETEQRLEAKFEAKWQGIVAEKDTAIANKEAENERLRLEIAELKAKN